MSTLTLKKRADSRIRGGHPLVFSNEVNGAVQGLNTGDVVEICSPTGKFLGKGFYEPSSRLVARIFSHNRREDITSAEFFTHRLREAVSLRSNDLATRLVHGEADALPGLVIDRYHDHLVLQFESQALYTHREALFEALRQVYPAKAAWIVPAHPQPKPSAPVPIESIWGERPERIQLKTRNLTEIFEPLFAEKTGLYLDQAIRPATPCYEGRRVLDVYAYSGSWARRALKSGATEAMMISKVERYCEWAESAAKADGIDGSLTIVCDEGKKSLSHLVTLGQRFGVVNIDPPVFAKNQKAVDSALTGYREIYTDALRLIEPGGQLIASLRGYAVRPDAFLSCIREAGREAGQRVRLIERAGQGTDHPELPGLDTSSVLKRFTFSVVPAR